MPNIPRSSQTKGELGLGELDNLKITFTRATEQQLRTPLSVIQGYAELLLNGELGELAPQQARVVSAIVRSAHEMRTLVERMGFLLSVERRIGISMPVSMRAVVTGAIREQQAAAQEAGLSLETRMDPDLPLVAGDPYQLHHAVACLVENAIRFTNRGGRIWVQVYRESERVCFAVSDTGVGIPEDQLADLFKAAPQTGEPDANSQGNTGFSLLVTKAIVDAHSGHIQVHSTPGQGSRFTICLPILLQADSAG